MPQRPAVVQGLAVPLLFVGAGVAVVVALSSCAHSNAYWRRVPRDPFDGVVGAFPCDPEAGLPREEALRPVLAAAGPARRVPSAGDVPAQCVDAGERHVLATGPGYDCDVLVAAAEGPKA